MNAPLSATSFAASAMPDPYEVLGIVGEVRALFSRTKTDQEFIAEARKLGITGAENGKNSYVRAAYEKRRNAVLVALQQEESLFNLLHLLRSADGGEREYLNKRIEHQSAAIQECTVPDDDYVRQLNAAFAAIGSESARRKYASEVAMASFAVGAGGVARQVSPPPSQMPKPERARPTPQAYQSPFECVDELVAATRNGKNIEDVIEHIHHSPPDATYIVDFALRRLTRTKEEMWKQEKLHKSYIKLVEAIYETRPDLFRFDAQYKRLIALAVNTELLSENDPRRDKNLRLVDSLQINLSEFDKGVYGELAHAREITHRIIQSPAYPTEKLRRAAIGKILGINLFQTEGILPAWRMNLLRHAALT